LKLRVDAVNSELTTQRQVLSRLGEDVLAIGTSVEESGATVRQLVERHAGPATCLFCRLNERMATRRCSRETGSPPGGERPRRDR
jgi:hypothetical protein